MKTNIFEMLGIKELPIVRRVIEGTKYLFTAWFASMTLYALMRNLGLDFLKTLQNMRSVDFSFDSYGLILIFSLSFAFIIFTIGYSLAMSIFNFVCKRR